jgi:hypothetical protein
MASQRGLDTVFETRMSRRSDCLENVPAATVYEKEI